MATAKEKEVESWCTKRTATGTEAMATLVGGGGVEAVLAGYRRRVAFERRAAIAGIGAITLFLCERWRSPSFANAV